MCEIIKRKRLKEEENKRDRVCVRTGGNISQSGKTAADSSYEKKLGYDVYFFVMEFHRGGRSCFILKGIFIRLE